MFGVGTDHLAPPYTRTCVCEREHMRVTGGWDGLSPPAQGGVGLGLDEVSSGSDSLLGAPKEDGLYFLFLFLRARGEVTEQTFLKPDPERTLEQGGLGLRLNWSESKDKWAPEGHSRRALGCSLKGHAPG